MAKLKLTRFSRVLIIIGILALVFFGGQFVLNNTNFGQGIREKVDQVSQDAEQRQIDEAAAREKANAEEAIARKARQEQKQLEAEQQKIDEAKAEKAKLESKNILKVQVKNLGGFAPGIYFNKGWDANEESRFYTEFGLKVQFELIDDQEKSREAWIDNDVNLFTQTIDALPTEVEDIGKYNPQVIMQTAWSRGEYAMVAKANIKSINDLRGKKIAVTPASAFHTYLIKLLDAADIHIDEIQLVKTADKNESLEAFNSGKVDAAMVCNPDNQKSIQQTSGSSVLHSTDIADFLIADVFVGKKDYINKNRDKINAFYQGWMIAASEINNNPSKNDTAATLFAEGDTNKAARIQASMNQTRMVTHQDNVRFFNKNGSYEGMTGKQIYSEMGKAYVKLKLATRNRQRWEAIADLVAVSTANNILNTSDQIAEQRDIFPEPTSNDQSKASISNKAVSINFSSGSFDLSESAKGLIDVKMGSLLRSFTNARIRIEGNTDNKGNRDMNIELSKKRAESVAYYLMSKYGIEKNRLMIRGNGPDKPVRGCKNLDNVACRTKNKRTEFHFVTQ